MKLINVKHLDNYRIESEFEDGQKRITDFKKFLFQNHSPMTTQFRDVERFKKVSIERGNLTWEDGQMDISAESIYQNAI